MPGDFRNLRGMSLPNRNAPVTKTPEPGAPALALMGPIVESIASPDQTDHQFAAWTGVLAPGVFVPLHAHPDAELAFVIDGTLDVFDGQGDHSNWLTLNTGESAIISPGARHALRNTADVDCRLILVSTASIGDFFAQIGRPVIAGAPPPEPTPEWLDSFAKEAARRGYWNGSPEENAAIGIRI